MRLLLCLLFGHRLSDAELHRACGCFLHGQAYCRRHKGWIWLYGNEGGSDV